MVGFGLRLFLLKCCSMVNSYCPKNISFLAKSVRPRPFTHTQTPSLVTSSSIHRIVLRPSASLQLVNSVDPEKEGVGAKSLDPTPAHPPIPAPTLHHTSLIIHVHRDSFHLIYYYCGGTTDCCEAPSPLDL